MQVSGCTSVSCSFKQGFSGDFQIATSLQAVYTAYNGRQCASLILSIVTTLAVVEEEPWSVYLET